MKRKKYLSLFLALVMTLGLAACGGGAQNADNAGGGEQPANDSAEAVSDEGGYKTDSLVVNIWDNNQRAGLQQIADEWSAKSGVKVSVEVISWNEYWTLLEAGASGGTLPDVFWMHINEAQRYMGADVPLSGFVHCGGRAD